jgi:hypothetical protein
MTVTTVYLPKDLHRQAREMKLNLSQLLREVLSERFGTKYGDILKTITEHEEAITHLRTSLTTLDNAKGEALRHIRRILVWDMQRPIRNERISQAKKLHNPFGRDLGLTKEQWDGIVDEQAELQ